LSVKPRLEEDANRSSGTHFEEVCMRINPVFHMIAFIIILTITACSGASQPPGASPTLEEVLSPSAPPPFPTATFTPAPTLTSLPTLPPTFTPQPTATYLPLAGMDLSKVVLQTADLPPGFILWKKYEGDQQKIRTAFAYLNQYNKAGEPLDNAILDATATLNNLQNGNYYLYYGINAPLQLLTCGVLVYSDEPSAGLAYQALTSGARGETLDLPVIGSESSGYAFSTPFSMTKTAGLTGLWINGMVKMGVPPELLPKIISGNRLVWRYHEAVLHLILLSGEKISQDNILALANLMQARVEGKQ